MIPRFAVAGHPNKGKSSIVATLAEDASVAISRVPGTTTRCRVFPMTIDGEVLYELIDTPGFQRPRRVLAWLEAHSGGTQDRADTVRRFVAAHAGGEEFHDECELLSPLIEGAGILYVVDGSHPYGSEYDAEMEILRWTGRPRMALINRIGPGDYVHEWQRALDQYFSIVRVFDALHADRDKRLALLRTFAELHPPWADAVRRAADALAADHARRAHDAARAIAALIVTALTAAASERIGEDEAPEPTIEALGNALRERLREAERAQRRDVESLYRHEGIAHAEESPAVIASDLFSEQSARLFGLSRIQLAASAAATGALAGGKLDLLAGGSSLFAGAGLGAVVAGAAALVGGDRLGRLRVLGRSLGTTMVTVGPFRDPNLPWVLLARASLHHALIAERNHARREALVLAAAEGHRADEIPRALRRRIEAEFRTIRERGASADTAPLAALIQALLQPGTADADADDG